MFKIKEIAAIPFLVAIEPHGIKKQLKTSKIVQKSQKILKIFIFIACASWQIYKYFLTDKFVAENTTFEGCNINVKFLINKG